MTQQLSHRHYLNRALLLTANIVSSILPPTRAFGIRRAVYRLAGLQIEPGVRIAAGARFHYSHVSIGEGAWIGPLSHFLSNAHSWINVGRRVDIGPGCLIATGSHAVGPPDRRAGQTYAQTITIGDGTWIGARSVILNGTTIGRGCIVAAGAVVRGTFPDNVLIGGVPARVIKAL